MTVYEAIKSRYSVRAYKNEPVPEEKLHKILDAARLAPSARNRQEWKFIVVRDKVTRRKLAEAASHQMFIAEAPVVIVACATEHSHIMRCDVPAYAVDLAIAVDHMTLVATEEGLGTCWIGAFNQDEVRKILDIPDTCKVVALLPLGYPADIPPMKFRKSLEEIVCYEKFE